MMGTAVLVVLIGVGTALYQSLCQQLSIRDDTALLNRLDQIRTLVLDEDVQQMLSKKPHLFTNMLGNTESLLVLRFPGEPPLIEVNPGQRPLPAHVPVVASRPINLTDVHHQTAQNGVPFISAAALAMTGNPPRQLEIITGRLMTERTQIQASYLRQITLITLCAALLVIILSALLARRSLRPLQRLARETSAIDVHHLGHRIALRRTPPELQPLISAFNQMLDRLQNSFQQLSQVSADMAHDLRTPIGNLMGQTEIALTQKRTETYYTTLLGSNFEELVRLSTMIDKMLFLARAENASLAINKMPLLLDEVLPPLADYFEGPAEERQITLRFSVAGTVLADADLLQRAVANLLANAIRYADSHSEIHIETQHQHDGVLLSVTNRGEAIPVAQQERLFDRFWRADSARHASKNSSGLGLSIVRSIMQLHQGGCGVKCEHRQTTFWLRFPH
jgi:two-component system heavy metal sensor histidine kinase CusS